MSESLRNEWPDASANFSDHKKFINKGIEAIGSTLILPEDPRFQIAYTLQVTGRGQRNAVLAEGPKGSGKTQFGDLMHGSSDRVDFDRDDAEDTAYGYTNPINPAEHIAGKLLGIRSKNPTLYANEVNHAANTGFLNRLWDGPSTRVNGEDIDLTDLVAYLTGNFPDGGVRVHDVDESLLSRISMMLLTGDQTEEIAAKIQGLNATAHKDMSVAPIVPDSAVRRSISQEVAERYPAQDNGKYIIELIKQLNVGGAVMPINMNDARIGQALHEVARANMLQRGVKEGDDINARQIAEVAALVLPKVARLSYVTKQNMNEEAGRRVSKLEEAIAVRRAVAKTAFVTLFEKEIIPTTDIEVQKAVDTYSYANASAAGFDIDAALAQKTSGTEDKEKQDGKRKIFGRRSR